MASTAENVLTLRFADPAVYERLKARAKAERTSMNRLAEEAVAAFVGDEMTDRVIDNARLAEIVRRIMIEDVEVLRALAKS
jgi:predicted transcriptional regulator